MDSRPRGQVPVRWFLLALSGACSPGDVESGDTASTADTADTSDTGGEPFPGDRDGDGVAADDGDCDDGDATVFPGADEVGGDGVDQDCDGSDHPATSIGGVAAILPGGEAEVYHGEVLTIGGDPPRLAATGTAGELVGHVLVYDGTRVMAGGSAELDLSHHDMTDFGQATAFLAADEGRTLVVAGFHDPSDYGGFCAWAAEAEGGLSPDDAVACAPTFEDNVDDRVGYGFAAGADLDGDGIADLALDGYADDGTGERRAALWFHAGPITTEVLASVPLQLVLMPSGSSLSVADVGDLDGDGYFDIVVSDIQYGGGYSGAAYLVSGSASPGALPPDSSVAIVGDATGGEMGAALATGDLDGDTQVDICLGAPLDNSAGERGGAAACFYGPLVGKQQFGDAPHRWVSESDHHFFGRSVAMLDTDGDGADEVAVSAIDDPYYPHGWPGKVYLYGTDDTATPRLVLRGEAMDLLGYAMAAGDLDVDGKDDLVVGAPYADANGVDSGAAYVISGASGAW